MFGIRGIRGLLVAGLFVRAEWNCICLLCFGHFVNSLIVIIVRNMNSTDILVYVVLLFAVRYCIVLYVIVYCKIVCYISYIIRNERI